LAAPAPAPAAAAPAAAPAAPGSLLPADLLGGMLAGLLPAARRAAAPPASLADVLDPDAVVALVRADAPLRAALLPHLPEGQRDLAALVDTLRSPQLHAALGALSEALQQAGGGVAGPNADAALAGFGLDPADGRAARARGEGAVGAFIAALIAEAEHRRAAGAGAGGAGAGADAGGAGAGSGGAGGGAQQ